MEKCKKCGAVMGDGEVICTICSLPEAIEVRNKKEKVEKKGKK